MERYFMSFSKIILLWKGGERWWICWHNHLGQTNANLILQEKRERQMMGQCEYSDVDLNFELK